MKQIHFVTGIDTDIGKSYATGYIAKEWAAQGKKVITQKLVQTGNADLSEDILLHRKIMGIDLQPVDLDRTTCPVVFSYPASPHLAAKLDGRGFDLDRIARATQTLLETCDTVLIEGAGGIMVPLSETVLTIDYIATHRLPVIIVTTPRLGSLSHTLLTLDACKTRDIEVHAIAWNAFETADELIAGDSKAFLQRYLDRHFTRTEWIDVPRIDVD